MPVEIGISDDYNVEIKSGVEEGTVVFTQMHHLRGLGLTPMAEHLIELRDVYKIYSEGLESEVRALDGVSLTIDHGEFVAVVGQSGSGKSTLMNVLGCLDIPTRGTYLLDGTDVQDLSDGQLSHIRNQQIGFIFQQYNLIQTLTVQENVELPLIYRGIDPDRPEGAGPGGAEPGGPRRPAQALSHPDVRRPAAESRHRPGHLHPSPGHHGG